jgi:hypothetical protein
MKTCGWEEVQLPHVLRRIRYLAAKNCAELVFPLYPYVDEVHVDAILYTSTKCEQD